jgi:hypothetical protein
METEVAKPVKNRLGDEVIFKHGDLVWLVGEFEALYMPYRVFSVYRDEKNSFATVLSECDWNTLQVTGQLARSPERMNFVYLSKRHPLGWRIQLADGSWLC